MTDRPFTIRPGADDDVPAIIELMKRSLGEGKIPRTREFWDWKHLENPFGRSPFWVAEAEGGLVGVRVFMRWAFRIHGGVVRAVRAVDTATDPAWQGRGIFRKLTLRLVDEMKAEGVSFVFNTPNDQSRPGYLKMGWGAVGRVSLWCRPRLLRLGLAGARRALGAATETPEASPTYRREDASGAAPLFLSGARPACLATPVTPEYLDWRYRRCPASAYGTMATGAESFVAYRVRTREGLRELTLCDAFFERSRRGIRGLAADVGRLLEEHTPDYAIASARFDAPECLAMTRAGFVPLPRSGPILTVRPLNEAPVDPLLPSAWAASVGDLELF